MMDLSLYGRLQTQGYKPKVRSTLKTMKKDELIDIIRCLENNWAVALERCDNQYALLICKEKEEE